MALSGQSAPSFGNLNIITTVALFFIIFLRISPKDEHISCHEIMVTCASVTVSALSVEDDTNNQHDNDSKDTCVSVTISENDNDDIASAQDNYSKDTCASVTVSALSVEAAAWKTGHFQNRG